MRGTSVAAREDLQRIQGWHGKPARACSIRQVGGIKFFFAHGDSATWSARAVAALPAINVGTGRFRNARSGKRYRVNHCGSSPGCASGGNPTAMKPHRQESLDRPGTRRQTYFRRRLRDIFIAFSTANPGSWPKGFAISSPCCPTIAGSDFSGHRASGRRRQWLTRGWLHAETRRDQQYTVIALPHDACGKC